MFSECKKCPQHSLVWFGVSASSTNFLTSKGQTLKDAIRTGPPSSPSKDPRAFPVRTTQLSQQGPPRPPRELLCDHSAPDLISSSTENKPSGVSMVTGGGRKTYMCEQQVLLFWILLSSDVILFPPTRAFAQSQTSFRGGSSSSLQSPFYFSSETFKISGGERSIDP